MNLSPTALWNFLKEVSNNNPLVSGALMWAFPVMLAWPLLIPFFISDFRLGDNLHYLLYKDPEYKQKELEQALNKLNRLIDEQEYLSFENYQHINDTITYKFNQSGNPQKGCPIKDIKSSDECYSIMLRENSNTYEFMRSFLQINDAYISLLRSNSDDGRVHRFIDSLYASLRPLLKPVPLCEDVLPSYSTLRSLHNRIDIIDDYDVRDRLNLEVLRLLTFSAAFLETKCKSNSDEGNYLIAMDIYNRRASYIANRRFKNPPNSLYLRKLFWLDLSKLVAEEKKGSTRNWKLYTEISNRLKEKLPPEFYKAKLNQNRNITRTNPASSQD